MGRSSHASAKITSMRLALDFYHDSLLEILKMNFAPDRSGNFANFGTQYLAQETAATQQMNNAAMKAAFLTAMSNNQLQVTQDLAKHSEANVKSNSQIINPQ
jgi:hypothetical protein